jgi:ribosomal protein S18 acetylase RimI-like enzyme
MIEIINAVSKKEIQKVRELFYEYAQSLGFNLDFQDFQKELDNLPGDYKEPTGKLFLANYGSKLVGCIALRKISINICEMKRLYVKPSFRHKGIGKALANHIIRYAREFGYKIMRLDTINSMIEANWLYKKLGFKEISPYRYNPIKGATFFELLL